MGESVAKAESGGLRVEFENLLGKAGDDLVGGTIDALGGGRVSYERSTTGSLVRSGVLYDNETIFYVRNLFGGNCAKSALLTITYPRSKQAQFASTVTTMSNSFTSTCR